VAIRRISRRPRNLFRSLCRYIAAGKEAGKDAADFPTFSGDAEVHIVEAVLASMASRVGSTFTMEDEVMTARISQYVTIGAAAATLAACATQHEHQPQRMR
jgi:hypothetical protein